MKVSKLAHVQASLAYVERRIKRAMSDQPVLSDLGLQYALCEVGPRRFDPRVLQHRIAELVKTKQCIRPLGEHIYCLDEIGEHEASALLPLLLEAAGYLEANVEAGSESLGDCLAHLVPSQRLAVERRTPEPIALKAVAPRSDQYFTCEIAAANTLVWVSHELGWIYPTDPRFWSFLAMSQKLDSRALLIARKVAPATFAICKQLGARALQYHALISSRPAPEEVQQSMRAARFPRMVPASSLNDHEMWIHVGKETEPRTPGASHALADATVRGFDVEEIHPLQLLDWADHASFRLPSEWYRGVHAWTITDSSKIESPAPQPTVKKHRATRDLSTSREAPEIHGRQTQVTRVPFRV